MLNWRATFLLLVAVIALAVAVVDVRYQARKVIDSLEEARALNIQLTREWSAIQVQQVTASRNEKIAELVKKQDMQSVNPSVTYYMTPGANAPAVAPTAAPASPATSIAPAAKGVMP